MPTSSANKIPRWVCVQSLNNDGLRLKYLQTDQSTFYIEEGKNYYLYNSMY